MISGALFRASDAELVAARMRTRRLLDLYNSTDPGDPGARHARLESLLSAVGPGTEVQSPFQCDYGWNITLGARVYINFNCVVLDCASVSIADDTLIGPGVQLCAVSHPVDPEERAKGLECAASITIGRNVWIAAAVVVGAGVTIGDDSTVGAGAVVLEDVPPRVVVAGNPARVVRRL